MICLVISSSVFAFPKAPFNALEQTSLAEFKFQDDDANLDYDFEGIVKLSNCSGAVVKFAGQPDTAKAYVLTNGHCLGGRLMSPGAVYTNRSEFRRMKVFDSRMNQKNIIAYKLVYATMTGTDSALYEIDKTYAELEVMGIRSFEMDSAMPVVGLPIDIVSGYWERGYRCYVDGIVFQLREADWTFTQSIRYTNEGCKTIGGTSGSPIIHQGTRIVVGVNNTINENGARCTLNNPCEVNQDGEVTVFPRTAYGQQTYMFSTCLTADFQIDLKKDGCELPKP